MFIVICTACYVLYWTDLLSLINTRYRPRKSQPAGIRTERIKNALYLELSWAISFARRQKPDPGGRYKTPLARSLDAARRSIAVRGRRPNNRQRVKVRRVLSYNLSVLAGRWSILRRSTAVRRHSPSGANFPDFAACQQPQPATAMARLRPSQKNCSACRVIHARVVYVTGKARDGPNIRVLGWLLRSRILGIHRAVKCCSRKAVGIIDLLMAFWLRSDCIHGRRVLNTHSFVCFGQFSCIAVIIRISVRVREVLGLGLRLGLGYVRFALCAAVYARNTSVVHTRQPCIQILPIQPAYTLVLCCWLT